MSAPTLERTGYARPKVSWNGLTVTDLFCGAGGSSSGLVAAGFKVLMAANHWAQAIESHQVNHPETDHDSADISQVEPRRFPTTDILWASPECTNHSVAKGIKRQRAAQEQLPGMEDKLPDDAAIRSRATMWDVPRFAEYHAYRAIIIENVVDAYRWVQFPAWLLAMELLGYEHEIAWVNSMHAQALGDPAPQSRDRMYIVFWKKNKASTRKPDLQKWLRPQAYCEIHGLISAVQTFKKAEHWGRYRAQYVFRCGQCTAIVEPAWLAAASVIDWSLKGTRIGDRTTDLSPKTMARIEKGIEKYWRPTVVEASGNTYDSTDPKHAQHGDPNGYIRAWPAEDPFRTLHTSLSKGIAFPPLITDGIRGEGTVQSGMDAMLTQTTAQTKGLLIPVEGREGKIAASTSEPIRTQSTRNETAIVIPLRNHGVAKGASEPIDTVSAGGNHHGLIVRGEGNETPSKPTTQPFGALTAAGSQFLATHPALIMRHNTARGNPAQMMTPVDEYLRTITTAGHQSLLVPYYGNGNAAPVTEAHRTLTTTDRYSLLTGPVDVNDCEFRMLTPDEIKRGMGFAADYYLGGTKREQVKQSGNAVTPPNARDLGAAVAEFLLGIDVAA